jgi:hypothetical protein
MFDVLLILLAVVGALMGWLAAGLLTSAKRSEVSELGALLLDSINELHSTLERGGPDHDAALAKARHALSLAKKSGLVG